MRFVTGLAVMMVIWLAVTAWRRSGKRWRIGAVECLRVVLVVMAVVLLWQPESTFQVQSDRQAEVVLLIDRSVSMLTVDDRLDGKLASRAEVARQIQSDPAWSRLDDRFKRVEEFIAEENPAQSDLAESLDQAARRHDSAVAYVLVSDGDFNRGRSPVQAAADLAARSGVKAQVHSIAVGDANRLPDIELVSVDVPTFGVVGKPVRIPFTIRNWFGELRDVTVSLETGPAVVDQQSITIRDGGRFDGSFTWQSDRAGTFSLAIDVPADASEINPANNRVVKRIEIRQEKLRVLVVESVPRWEYRYLRNALLRDPGIDVSCMLYHPGLPVVGGGGEDYLSMLPEEPAEWASYDVIFLGDVGVAADQLTVEQCRQIRGLVEQQAVGLVLMPGLRGAQASLLQSELGELFPVVLDPARPMGIGNESASSFVLTNEGRRSLLTQLDDDSQSNWSIWESLPGFYWSAAVIRAKAGSEVLAVDATASNQYGRVPLLVTRGAGAGKVLFMGTDAIWRWRMGVEDKYHYRFWGQAIRWMAYQRNMAVGETMRLSYRPEQPSMGETVSIRASVMNRDGTPSQAESAIIEVLQPGDSSRRVTLQREGAEWGVFLTQTQFDQPGAYTLNLSHPSERSSLKANLEVQGVTLEQEGRPARPDIMREIANVGRGNLYASDQIGILVDQLNGLPPDPSATRRIEWWNHPAVLLAMIAGMSLFWVGRKWSGAI